MTKHFYKRLPFWGLIVLIFVVILSGCKGSSTDSQNEIVNSGGTTLRLNLWFQSIFETTAGSTAGSVLNREQLSNTELSHSHLLSSANGVLLQTSEIDTFYGTLKINNSEGVEIEDSPLAIAITINRSTWTATLDKTIGLSPGQYTFELIVSKGNERYTGSSSLYTVTDGIDNVLPLSLVPVLGDASFGVSETQQFSCVQFTYPANQLSDFSEPKLGIKLNGSPESIYSINKGTGTTSTCLDLASGSNTVELSFYDKINGITTQIGKSIDSQEGRSIVPGNDFTMDIVPLEV